MFRIKMLFAVLFTLLLTASGCTQVTEDYLQISFLKIGKADAIILNTQKSAVLIDAGEDDDGSEILEKAKSRGIERFDYMIITHYDKDHVGGAAEVIKGIEIGEIIEPGYEKSSDAYSAFCAAANNAGIKRTVPEGNISFVLDGVHYDIMMPIADRYPNENDCSIAVKATYFSKSALFTGDALDIRMDELMNEDISCNILKVPHHGSYEGTSKEFFNAASAQYAVITCSDKNPADEKTVLALEEAGAKPLLTSNGDIQIFFTEKNIEVLQ